MILKSFAAATDRQLGVTNIPHNIRVHGKWHWQWRRRRLLRSNGESDRRPTFFAIMCVEKYLHFTLPVPTPPPTPPYCSVFLFLVRFIVQSCRAVPGAEWYCLLVNWRNNLLALFYLKLIIIILICQYHIARCLDKLFQSK